MTSETQAITIATKPYDCLAVLLTDPVMNRMPDRPEFLTGFSKHLDVPVTLHYRKANQSTARDGAYLAQWAESPTSPLSFPFLYRQKSQTFQNILEMEMFLRPECADDLSWIHQVQPEVKLLLNKALTAYGQPLNTEEMLLAADLVKLYRPESRALEPDRFRVPFVYRTALAELLVQVRAGEMASTHEMSSKLDPMRNWFEHEGSECGLKPFP